MKGLIRRRDFILHSYTMIKEFGVAVWWDGLAHPHKTFLELIAVKDGEQEEKPDSNFTPKHAFTATDPIARRRWFIGQEITNELNFSVAAIMLKFPVYEANSIIKSILRHNRKLEVQNEF